MSTPLRERPDAPLGTLIFRAGLLPAETIESALEEGVKTGKRLGEILTERGLIQEADVARLLAGQKGLNFVTLREQIVDPAAAGLFSEDQARLFRALPYAFDDGVPVVAIADPTDEVLTRNVREALGREDARFVVSIRSELAEIIGEVYAEGAAAHAAPLPSTPAPAPAPEAPSTPDTTVPGPAGVPVGHVAPPETAEREPEPVAAPPALEPVAPSPLEPVAPPAPEPVAPSAPEPVAPSAPESVATPPEPEPIAAPPAAEAAAAQDTTVPGPGQGFPGQPEPSMNGHHEDGVVASDVVPATPVEPVAAPGAEPSFVTGPEPAVEPPVQPVPAEPAPAPAPPVLAEPIAEVPVPAAEPPAAEPAVAPAATPPPAPGPAEPAPPSGLEAPQHVQAAPAPGALHRLTVRLVNGERVDAGAYGDLDAAKAAAKELMAEVAAADGGDWPFVSGRFLKPDTIVSVDIS